MLDIQQPTSGVWLKPKDINGHLLLVLKVHRLDTRFDQLAGADKEYAEFTMVDLDTENPVPVTVLNSHPGIVGKIRSLAAGQAVLGRIAQVPGAKATPAWVLTEFTPGVDDIRAKAWLDANPGALTLPSAASVAANPANAKPARSYPSGAAPAMQGVATAYTSNAAEPANTAEIEALKARLAQAQGE
jgi:hypothetical protein